MEYKMRIKPRILEFLGPNLYTNIYFVLAELITNAYDADAKNVFFIIKPDKIIVEDDGKGMTYDEIDQKFLDVAKETRKNSLESQTEKLKRMKMGRKGVGKLAALSVSEYVDVMTVKNNEKNGFVMTIHMDDTGNLEAIEQSNINFMKIINDHGTSIIMKNPKYRLHKSLDTIAKNISRVFPIFNSDFRMHIKDSESKIINSFNLDVFKNLSTIITIGDKYNVQVLKYENLVKLFL